MSAASHEPVAQCPRCGTWVSDGDLDVLDSCPGCSLPLAEFEEVTQA